MHREIFFLLYTVIGHLANCTIYYSLPTIPFYFFHCASYVLPRYSMVTADTV